MDRMVLDLGTERKNYSIAMNRWKYLFVGDCTGVVTIKLGSTSASPLNPNEFDKLTGIENYAFMFVDNDAQSDDTLNIYFEEEELEEDVVVETR